jgi:hypothetical protein
VIAYERGEFPTLAARRVARGAYRAALEWADDAAGDRVAPGRVRRCGADVNAAAGGVSVRA